MLWEREKDAKWRWSSEVSYANAHSMGNKHEELEICVQLQGFDVGSTDVVGQLR